MLQGKPEKNGKMAYIREVVNKKVLHTYMYVVERCAVSIFKHYLNLIATFGWTGVYQGWIFR